MKFAREKFFLFCFMAILCLSTRAQAQFFMPAFWQSRSCSLPWGGTIYNTQSVTAYLAANPSCGVACASQTRTCGGGVLSNSYTASSCSYTVCPANVVLISGSGSGMNVTGPGNPVYGSYVIFTFQNQGATNTVTTSTSLSDTTNFEFGTNNCTGIILTPNSTCTVQVRSKATYDGSFTTNLNIFW